MISRPASPDATLVNISHHDERTSLRLKIPCGKSNILNSVVVDAAGQSLYTIASNSKRTTFVECKDNVEIVTVQWDRSSPRMVFRRKKMKCREWLPPAGPETESVVQTPLFLVFCCRILKRNVTSRLSRSRVLAHGDSRFVWMQKSSSTSGYGCISCHLGHLLRD